MFRFSRSSRRSSPRRRIHFEKLERREMLAADGISEWRHPIQPWDTNDDGRFNVVDVFTNIELVRERGFGRLPYRTPSETRYADTDGDGSLTAIDVFLQIDVLREKFKPPREVEVPEYVYSTTSDQALVDFPEIESPEPDIIIGDIDGEPPANLDDRWDPNKPSSPFAGVVTVETILNERRSGFCTGAFITPTHVITAAHCVDNRGGVNDDGDETGDGAVDFELDKFAIHINHKNEEYSRAGIEHRRVTSITLPSEWSGFQNANTDNSTHDDIAILTVNEPAPEDVPTYALATTPLVNRQPIVLAGYGVWGTGVVGEVATGSPWIKLTGQNVASADEVDEEGSGRVELYAYDFDGPTAATNTLGDDLTLGNDIEVKQARGDSGSPTLIWADGDEDDKIDKGELTLFGVNSHSYAPRGIASAYHFGAIGVGMAISGYLGFVSDTLQLDFGDAPDAKPGVADGEYETKHADDGARHIAVGPMLGNLRDVETDAQANGRANGDLDEDGVAFGDLFTGQPVEIQVASSGNGAKLEFFADWNADGRFVESESYEATLSESTETIQIDVPESAKIGETVIRFRISTAGGYGSKGLAFDGEVEDYLVTIEENAPPPEPPVLNEQGKIAGDIFASWTGGAGTTEIFVYSDPTSYDSFVKRQKAYGGAKEMLIGGLDDGDYYLAGRGIYWADDQWRFTSFSPRMKYVVEGDSKHPTLLEQEKVSGDMEIRWRGGAPTTEIFVFTDPADWNSRVGAYKVYGAAKSLTIPHLEDGDYFLAARGIYKEGDDWVFTAFNDPRVLYRVEGEGRHPLVRPQEEVTGDLVVRWDEGVNTTELFIHRDGKFVDKHKVYGGAKEFVLPYLEDDTYEISARGIYGEPGDWKFTSLSPRVPYRIAGPGRHPIVAPQDEILSGEIQVEWSEGLDTTEIIVFKDAEEWVVEKKAKAFGGGKQLTIDGLPDGDYYVGARGIYQDDDGDWAFTQTSFPRKLFKVRSLFSPDAAVLSYDSDLDDDSQRPGGNWDAPLHIADPKLVDEALTDYSLLK